MGTVVKKSLIFWAIAIVITLTAAWYQRVTGPTYPLNAAVTVDGIEYRFELIRSHGGDSDAEIRLPIPAVDVSAEINWRRYPTQDTWTATPFVRDGDALVGRLPKQPAAAKLEYYLTIHSTQGSTSVGQERPVTIRFKGDVPEFVLIPHIILMFAAMLISNLAGLMALFRDQRFRKYTIIAFALIAVGGMILGPIVQYYAFGDWWTGVPFGWDLTDNKTLIAFVAFGIAMIGTRGRKNAWLVVLAALVMLAVFSIPHSMFGSEFDYTSGVIRQA
jgi:hypothetical protein